MIKHTMIWQTTPAKLRTLADHMEKKYLNLLPGNSTKIVDIVLSTGDILEVHVHQGKYDKELRDENR